MKEDYYIRKDCRLCRNKNLDLALPLAPTALCDAYLTEEKKDLEQDIFPLDLFLCKECGFVQIGCVVNPETIYRDYIYVSTSSMGLDNHFNTYADDVISRLHLKPNTFVIDIGSNDGMLLKWFKKSGMKVVGIEPATEIAKEANQAGIETYPEFLNPELASRIQAQHGQADVITINNLFANVDNLEELAGAVSNLLVEGGVFIIESSYLGDMIGNMVFDFIYHEHLSYLSISPLMRFFGHYNMDLIDIQKVDTKGGSRRYYFQKRRPNQVIQNCVNSMIKEEESLALNQPATYERYAEQINNEREKLHATLTEYKNKGIKIVGYGASATSTTLIYHYGLSEFLEYLVDDNPAKINTYSPGFHIPVLSSEVLDQNESVAVLILAWRYSDQIMDKHGKTLHPNSEFIVPLPKMEVVS